ncbi:hypothetical protein PG994_008088 [Apiospora phragmitis]|uniref:Uncharacterized protein n=1 Tax=Apiospora phragmitis TaxID=2905665 RepID=A0ABR1US40_9PEZI
MVFRKSDVQWAGNPRGWQMILSYSFKTRVTSGTKNAKLGEILSQLKGCGSPVHHPLLLPVIMLCQELGARNEKQRDIRRGIRELETLLIDSYRDVKETEGHIRLGDLTLEKISQKITEYQSEVNWKRPQAWKSALAKIHDAAHWWWDNRTDSPRPALDKLHRSLLDRLLFYNIKLDDLENYARISLSRLDNLRQVMRVTCPLRRVLCHAKKADPLFLCVKTNRLISQVESRLNAEISIQQQLLANASKRDSASMKTLTILGAVFLPGLSFRPCSACRFSSSMSSVYGGGVDRRMVLQVGSSIGTDEDNESAEAHLNSWRGRS